jgi:hypothetical protein
VSERQSLLDQFYASHGPCCAGCDWWRHYNAVAGGCTRSAPVAGRKRWAMLNITGLSLATESGHIMTRRDHVCGEFKDEPTPPQEDAT